MRMHIRCGALESLPLMPCFSEIYAEKETLNLRILLDNRDVRHTLPRGGFVTIVQPKDEFGGLEDRRFQVPLRYGRIDYDKVCLLL